jgi:hypothetical protein
MGQSIEARGLRQGLANAMVGEVEILFKFEQHGEK